jgi:hypothetical protein
MLLQKYSTACDNVTEEAKWQYYIIVCLQTL